MGLLALAGCASQSTDFGSIDQEARHPASISVVVTQRSTNACWTNADAVAEVAAANLSTAYDRVSITSFNDAISEDELVFQVFGWTFRRGGVCFGNFRVSLGFDLEVKDNGFIDTISAVTSPKRKAILGSPAKLNESLLVYVDDVSARLAERMAGNH